MKITDTLSGRKKEFKPLGDTVSMYVCGINPYSDSHIGHALSYIFFDVVRRYLEFRGYKVRHVENITDVEDNIINHANRLGITVKELTEKYAARHFEDMDALNNLRPHFTPKATETIPEIIAMAQGLIENGYGYAVGGNVYFRVRKVPDYGKLSRRSLDQMMAGARVEASEAKEDPMDFVLWKESKLGEPSWDSPWGKGRPGWHIECSAMSRKFLGDQIDIHGGGQDVVFPHHENEIAQSEAFTGKTPFVQFWMHNGLLRMGEEKMSKSLGNLITIRDALYTKHYSADAIRIFILSSYYRSPLTYTEEAIQAAQSGADSLNMVFSETAEKLREKNQRLGKMNTYGPIFSADSYRQKFISAMDDDFSTAQAIAVLFDLARETNTSDNMGIDTHIARATLKELGGVLGLTFKVTTKLTTETEIYNKYINTSLEEYGPKIIENFYQPIESELTQFEDTNSIFENLLKKLRNQFAHGEYGSLDSAESYTQQYKNSLDSLHNEIVQNNFEGVLGSLSSLSTSSVANIDSYTEFRDELRKNKEYRYADIIRENLDKLDITLEDTVGGTVWKKKR